MRSERLAAVLEDSRSGFWGADAGLSDVDVRVVRNGDVQEEGIRWAALPLRGVAEAEAARAAIRKDDILITTSGDCGFAAHVTEDPAEPTIASNFVRILRFDADRVVPRYMFRCIQSPAFQARLRPYVRGTTLKNLSLATAAEHVSVPLPDKPEQRRIAALLEKADALRGKRRAALAQLDTLTQSIFLDMFGDPATNPKGWVQQPAGRLGSVTTGNTPPREDPGNYGDAIEWIKSDNLNAGDYYATRASEHLSEAGMTRARIAPAGAILITCIAGSPSSIGNAAMVDRPVAFNQQINAFVPEQGNPHFFFAQLRVGKRLVQQASTGGMKGMVSKSRFERILLIAPPRDRQDQFAELVLRVARVKSDFQASMGHVESLFDSLQRSAFPVDL